MDKVFLQALSKSLQELDFKNTKHSWYKYSQDLIRVIDLQRSEYSDFYYINFGFYVKAIGCDHEKVERCAKTPPESHCHLRMRAEAFLTEDEMKELNDAMVQRDAEKTMGFFDKLYKMHFESVETNHDLKNKVASNVKYINRCDKRLKDFFGMTLSS